MERRVLLQEGRLVEHFKRDFLSEEERLYGSKYIYQIKGIASHTETGEEFVVYQAMYPDENGKYRLYVRPIEMFLSEVDKVKYPNSGRKYRFTIV